MYGSGDVQQKTQARHQKDNYSSKFARAIGQKKRKSKKTRESVPLKINEEVQMPQNRFASQDRL